jgi:hypothetical protein
MTCAMSFDLPILQSAFGAYVEQHRLNDRLNLPDTPHRETGLAGQVGLERRSRLRIPRAAAQTRTVSSVVL